MNCVVLDPLLAWLLLVSLIRSLDLQVCLQQPFIRLSQQECGLDDLGVAPTQPFTGQFAANSRMRTWPALLKLRVAPTG
jgi:hypothetical protein